MKLGIIARQDASGLGNQSRNLTYMLKPDRLLVIDSTPFNGHAQHPEWYDGYTGIVSKGFPDNITVRRFLSGLTHVLTAETFYSSHLVELANRSGIKTFNQYNWEFLDNLKHNLPVPYKWLAPSHWKLDEMKAKFDNVEYLPPPIFLNDFKSARELNMKRKGKRRFCHVVGKQATHDRNGTEDILRALHKCLTDFELVIQSQFPLDYRINDRRVIFDFTDKPEPYQLYEDYDAMILPRRYGGNCLPLHEALSSGLPVIMTDIEPNNRILPKEWLVDSSIKTTFQARVPIECYQSDLDDLARVIDNFASMSDEELEENKLRAFDLAYKHYSTDSLIDRYRKVLEL